MIKLPLGYEVVYSQLTPSLVNCFSNELELHPNRPGELPSGATPYSMNIAILPLKNDAPLIVNSYAMKSCIVST